MSRPVTPVDMLEYVLNNELEARFLNSIAYHVGEYTIAEIVDKQFIEKNGKYRLFSKAYSVNVDIEDDDVLTALINKMYVTPFISRHEKTYQIHFLVHQYPESMKSQFDENILAEVLQYMILKTIVALRLDSEAKIDEYIKKANI